MRQSKSMNKKNSINNEIMSLNIYEISIPFPEKEIK